MAGLSSVERALRNAAPHALLDVVAAELRERFAAREVVLRMVDYGLTSLRAVCDGPGAPEPVWIATSPQGRAFGAQAPWVEHDSAGDPEGVAVHFPVTTRGDRMGVLSVTLPAGGDAPGVAAEIQHLCEALGHEILVAGRDTDFFLVARRAARLTLAAEMQWELLPGRSVSRPEFSLGAHLEPAYAIFGDSFDWSVSADHLTLSVTNGMGQGMDAALLTGLAVNALRNARRAGLGLVDQACLADDAVYAQYKGASHVSVLLLRFHFATGEVEAVDAGSPRAWRLRDRRVDAMSFDAQLPLGMFGDTLYCTETFRVRRGDRLLFGSDGVYDSASVSGQRYGDRDLARSLASTALLPSSQVPGAVLHALAEHHGRAPLDDDALVLCLDWFGRGA